MVVKKLKAYLEKIKKEDKKINSFLFVRDEKELLKEAKLIEDKISKGGAGRLAGYIIGIKANINVIGFPISCASKVLEDYLGTYDATVVEKIKKEDGIIIGILNCDEFACGSSGETSAFGPTHNPVNLSLIPGGSSSGSAAAVAAGFCDVALGSDTGGSLRNPASHCGVVGLKPSYGTVSRYGLIDLAMSLDQIGPIGKNVYDCALLLDVIKGKDEYDSISVESPKLDLKNLDKNRKFTIGVLDLEIQNKEIKKLIDENIKKVAEKKGWKIVKVKIPYIDLAVETYYPIVYTEFFSATRKFDGRRYGEKIENACGTEVLRRLLGGSEITRSEHKGRYYHLALRVKDFISREFEKVFNEVDVIISPTVPQLPYKIGEKLTVEEIYDYDLLTIPANLFGGCAISIPCGKIKGIPVGMQVMGRKFGDQNVLNIASLIEKELKI